MRPSALLIVLWCGIALAAWLPPTRQITAPAKPSYVHFDKPYLQRNSTRFTYYDMPLAEWGVLPVPSSDPFIDATPVAQSSLVLLRTRSAVWTFDTDSHAVAQLPLRDAPALSSGAALRSFVTLAGWNMLFVATPTALSLCNLATSQCSASRTVVDVGAINDMVLGAVGSSAVEAWLATERGLFWAQLPIDGRSSGTSAEMTAVGVDDVPITAVAISLDGTRVVAGTQWRLWVSTRLAGASSEFGLWFFVGGLIDATPTAMAFDNKDNLWVGNEVCLNVLIEGISWHRVAAREGLPMADITSLAYDARADAMWIGAHRGVARTMVPIGSLTQWLSPGATGFIGAPVSRMVKFHYFFGSRYLPANSTNPALSQGNNVTALAVPVTGLAFSRVVVVTGTGLAVLEYRYWTLHDKAAHYQAMINPRHNRFGLSASTNLAQWGNTSSYILRDNDNDGLWTSLYAAAMVFRTIVTNETEARAAALAAFDGIAFLNNVSGIWGYPARSVIPGLVAPPYGMWWPSTTNPGWTWKGDTSSDEVCGHMMIFPLMYDVIAESDDDKRHYYAQLSLNMTQHIIDGGYLLRGVNNRPTTWGYWAPEQLNGRWDRLTEYGLNALEILSWLQSSIRFASGSQLALFESAYEYLAHTSHYLANLINAKITDPADVNYSDDELTFVPYLTWLWAKLQNTSLPAAEHTPHQQFVASLEKELVLSMRRTFSYQPIRHQNASLYTYIYLSVIPEDPEAESLVFGAADTLQDYPLELIDWPIDNSQRLDLFHEAYVDRHGRPEGNRLLPYGETSHYRWNSNPYALGPTGSGHNEVDPAVFLISYWFGRWTGHISAPTE